MDATAKRMKTHALKEAARYQTKRREALNRTKTATQTADGGKTLADILREKARKAKTLCRCGRRPEAERTRPAENGRTATEMRARHLRKQAPAASESSRPTCKESGHQFKSRKEAAGGGVLRIPRLEREEKADAKEAGAHFLSGLRKETPESATASRFIYPPTMEAGHFRALHLLAPALK
eukprot:g96.t1